MNNKIKALVIITTFMFCHYMMRNFWGDSWSEVLLTLGQQTYLLLTPVRYLFMYGPLVLVATLLFKEVSVQEILGLKTAGHQRYFLTAAVCCVPMVIGYAFLSIELNLSWSDIVTGSIYAGVFEEIIFRAALFGALFRYCRLGFIPAALVSSLIFGLGHIYQGHDAVSALMVVSITAIAGAWFSWLYCECGYRIWFPLWMHIFMNAAYTIFGMSGGAVGDLEANIFKASSIILSLVYVNLIIRRGKKREVTLASLWRNQSIVNQPTVNSPACLRT
ncbi:MAG: CPBP family intramembrane metalloprotease [Alteromonadaceae bacterium]|nr:CPBP family intramembrane metalloprotease [Alteromonadaceae bacterium]